MIYRMLRRAVWLCCGFGFLGLWKIPPNIDGEKHGIAFLQIKPKIDAGSKRVQNKQLNSVCKYLVTGVYDFDVVWLINQFSFSSYVHLCPSVKKQDYFSAVVANRLHKSVRGFFDKKYLVDIQKKLPSFDITVLDCRILQESARVFAHKEAILYINNLSQKDEMNCKHCGLTLVVDSAGDCNKCDNDVMDDLFNTSAFLSDILKGKPKSIERYRKAA